MIIVSNLQIAEVGRLKPLEVELQKLEDLSESIVKDFAYMRQRESEMRDTNGNVYLYKFKVYYFLDCLELFISLKLFILLKYFKEIK